MCGIIGAIANSDVTPLLLHGLNQLEYRGYDSSGLIVLSQNNKFNRARSVGKVINLAKNINSRKRAIEGKIGIAHTRWATHGEPANKNAHPHISKNSVSVVHNGIIENYVNLKRRQINLGYKFTSETDSEVIAHEIDLHLEKSETLVESVINAVKSFQGSYGIGVISSAHPNVIIAARKGSPLVIGIGENGNYIASDQLALLSKTNKFVFLQDGDVAEITKNHYTIYDLNGNIVNRSINTSNLKEGQVVREI